MKAPSTEPAAAGNNAPDLVSVRILKPDVTVGDDRVPVGKVIPLDKARADVLKASGLAEDYTPQPGDELKVKVRVLYTGANLAGMRCAEGHEAYYPKPQADLFVKEGLAVITGV